MLTGICLIVDVLYPISTSVVVLSLLFTVREYYNLFNCMCLSGVIMLTIIPVCIQWYFLSTLVDQGNPFSIQVYRPFQLK